MGKLIDPRHVLEDPDHEDVLELRQKEKELRRRIDEKKLSVFQAEPPSPENDFTEGKALVEPEAVFKLARKLDLTPDEVVERYMNDEDNSITLESFFEDTLEKEYTHGMKLESYFDGKVTAQDEINVLDEMYDLTTDETERKEIKEQLEKLKSQT
jgi:NAD-specific glutamate dehydrogenase